MAPTPDELRKELSHLGQYITHLQERFAELDSKIAEFESGAATPPPSPVQGPAEIRKEPEQAQAEDQDGIQVCVRCHTPRREHAQFCAECGMQYVDGPETWDAADVEAAAPITIEEQAPAKTAPAPAVHEEPAPGIDVPMEQAQEAPAEQTPPKLSTPREPSIASFAQQQEPEPAAQDYSAVRVDTPARLSESDIGTRWFGIAGIALVVVAFAFFIKYAIDSGWIGPLLRVAGGVIIGAGVVGLGVWFDTRQAFKGYARILIGGGFALVYFALFAAYYFYSDSIAISQAADLALLTATVAGAIWFSVRMDSLVLAAEAFLLGYATAYLGGVVTVFTLSYNVVLAMGLVYLVWRKGWFSLAVAGLAATYIMHIFWLQANLDKSLTNMVFLLCYFAMFAAVGIAEQQFVSRTGDRPGKTALPPESRYLLYAVAALNLFLPVSMAPRDDIFLVYYLAADLAVFVMALQFSMAGLGLCAVGVNYFAFVLWHNAHGANTGLAILFLACIYAGFTLYAFMLRSMQRRLPFENVITVFLNTFCFFALLFKKINGDYSDWSGLFTLAMGVLNLGLCKLAARREDNTLRDSLLVVAVVFLTLAIPVQLTKSWLPLSWAAESVALVYLSFKLNNAILRQLSRAVAVIAFVSLFPIDIFHEPMGLVFVTVTAGCYFLRAWLYHHYLLKPDEINGEFLETCGYALVAAGLILAHIAFMDQVVWIRYACACAWGMSLLGAGMALRLYWLHPAALFVHAAVLLSTAYTYGTSEWSAAAVLVPQMIAYAACSLPLIAGPTPKAFEDYKYAGYAYEMAAAAVLTVYLRFVVPAVWLPAAWAVESVALLLVSFAGSRAMRRLYGQIAAVLALAGIAQLIAGPGALIPVAAPLVAAAMFFARAWIYHAHVFKRQQLDRAFVETYAYAMAGAVFVYLLIGNLAHGAWALSAGQCAWALMLVAAGAALRLYWLQIAGLTLNIMLVAGAYPDLAHSVDAPLAVMLPRVLTLYAAMAIHARQSQEPPFEALSHGVSAHAAAATALLTIMLALVFNGHWISIAWAAEAVAIIVAGVALKHRIVRYSGMGLFVLTLGKVLLLDMASLDVGYRFVSLFGVGLLLLIASYLYYRFRDRIEDLL